MPFIANAIEPSNWCFQQGFVDFCWADLTKASYMQTFDSLRLSEIAQSINKYLELQHSICE